MLNKVTYINNQTVIGANNLNNIQDEIINNSNEINDLKSNTIMKNYSIIDGMNEPINPTENMIWIQVENFNQVHFSDVKPSKLNNNDIWIQTGNASNVTFNSIKIDNNTINTIHPISAQQYINGELVDIVAKSYQNGGWVSWWNGELYDAGNQYGDFTGGWFAYPNSSAYVVFNTNNIQFINGSSTTSAAAIYTQNKIDITGFSNLRIKGNVTDYDDYNIKFGIVNSNTTGINPSFVTYGTFSKTGDMNTSVDLSNTPDGSYYISIWSQYSNFKITQIILER